MYFSKNDARITAGYRQTDINASTEQYVITNYIDLIKLDFSNLVATNAKTKHKLSSLLKLFSAGFSESGIYHSV